MTNSGEPVPGQVDPESIPPSQRPPDQQIGVAWIPERLKEMAAKAAERQGAHPLVGRRESDEMLRRNLEEMYISANELNDKLHLRLLSETVVPGGGDSLVLFQNATGEDSVPGILVQGGLVLVSPDEFNRVHSNVVMEKTRYGPPDIRTLPDDFDLKYDLVDDNGKMEKWKDGVSRSKEATERIVRQEIATKEFVPQGTAYLRNLSQSLTPGSTGN